MTGRWGKVLLSPGSSTAHCGSARGLLRMSVRSLPSPHVVSRPSRFGHGGLKRDCRGCRDPSVNVALCYVMWYNVNLFCNFSFKEDLWQEGWKDRRYGCWFCSACWSLIIATAGQHRTYLFYIIVANKRVVKRLCHTRYTHWAVVIVDLACSRIIVINQPPDCRYFMPGPRLPSHYTKGHFISGVKIFHDGTATTLLHWELNDFTVTWRFSPWNPGE